MATRAREFWADINNDIASAMERIIPKRGIVDSVIAQGVKIKPQGSTTALGEPYARLSGEAFEVNDEVAYLNLGGKPFILGKIWRGANPPLNFGVLAKFLQGIQLGSTGVTIQSGSGTPEGTVTAPVGSAYLRTDTGALYLKASGVGNTGWSGVGSKRIVPDYDTQNNPSTGSNTSTSTYEPSADLSLVLPAGGNFTVLCYASGFYYHSSAGSNVRHRARIDGNDADYVSIPVGDSGTRSVIDGAHIVTGIAGGQTIVCEGVYRPSTGGTAYSGGGTVVAIGFEE